MQAHATPEARQGGNAGGDLHPVAGHCLSRAQNDLVARAFWRDSLRIHGRPERRSKQPMALKKTSPKAAPKKATPEKAATAPQAAPAKAAEKPAAGATITLKQLAAQIAEAHDMQRKQADAMLAGTVDAIVDHLKEGNRIRINGLGILEVKKRSARLGRNPATGEQIQIKASKKVAFRAAKELKEAV
jgi:DNA-binding protein HU-beta